MTSISSPYQEEVCRELLLLEEKEGSGCQASNRGGWHSSSDILLLPPIVKLFTDLLPTLEAYASFLGLDSACLTVTAWANINRNFHENDKHAHEDALFSGCYYVKGDLHREFTNGAITFFKKDQKEEVLATLHPEPGDLLLFPSDMYHRVSLYQGCEERISIAFNLHFGTVSKSWVISRGKGAQFLQRRGIPIVCEKENFPLYVDDSPRRSMLFPLSALKKKGKGK